MVLIHFGHSYRLHRYNWYLINIMFCSSVFAGIRALWSVWNICIVIIKISNIYIKSNDSVTAESSNKYFFLKIRCNQLRGYYFKPSLVHAYVCICLIVLWNDCKAWFTIFFVTYENVNLKLIYSFVYRQNSDKISFLSMIWY